MVAFARHLHTGQLSEPKDTPKSQGYRHLIGGQTPGAWLVVCRARVVVVTCACVVTEFGLVVVVGSFPSGFYNRQGHLLERTKMDVRNVQGTFTLCTRKQFV